MRVESKKPQCCNTEALRVNTNFCGGNMLLTDQINVTQLNQTDHTSVPCGDKLTMSSREIAELTGKQHSHVMRDIRNQESAYCEVYGVESKFGLYSYVARNSKTISEYKLTKSQALFVVSGYDSVRRARVQKRMEDLEQELTCRTPVNLSRMDILQLAMDAERKSIEQQNKIVRDAPKVEFANTVAIAPDAIDVGKAAKILGVGRNRMFEFLRRIAWVTRTNEPYQRIIELGYMDVKVSEFDVPEYGLKRNVKALVTGKGLLKLQALVKERLYVQH
ncbi:phage regulatory protein/antirepressor Ant [Vibrio scophthalmi]|uniref:phage regulatory protein/antirepressor Ant n=1 Tax=Vibrio scophthalmi TaxID=45658 RepID=UPI00228434B6|nr:phage regulatory protein/antirepressor Ant [Vibrio scophthalmi]MCY9802711.1 phage regulatory protein/antirepressor Ant [Vibrio scophthalmi]